MFVPKGGFHQKLVYSHNTKWGHHERARFLTWKIQMSYFFCIETVTRKYSHVSNFFCDKRRGNSQLTYVIIKTKMTYFILCCTNVVLFFILTFLEASKNDGSYSRNRLCLNPRKFNPRKTHFWTVFWSQSFSAVSSTPKISIKIFQIHHRIWSKYSQNFRGLPIHRFAQKSNFNRKIPLELFQSSVWYGIIDTDCIILDDFKNCLHTIIKLWVKFTWV